MGHQQDDRDALRRRCTEVANHLVDEFNAGRLSRRGFFQRGAVLGLSAPLMSGLVGGGLSLFPSAARAAGNPGGTIRVGLTVPTASIDPVAIADAGGLIIIQQLGDFLIYDGPDLILKPMLAESWKPNKDGSVWTFKLRQGVKFHSGKTLTADDVVATFDRLADPANSSNALSVFSGVLSKGNTKKVDDLTVEFHLDAPNGNFPYSVSTDNYNAIILPASFDGGYEKSFDGTGPFRMEKYTPKVGASFVRNPDYWGGAVLPDRLEFSFYADQQPQILALMGGQVDVLQQVVVQGGQAILSNPDIEINRIKAATHRQVHMRTDSANFKDKRVRQALALALDRQAIVKGLFRGMSDLGNDSPMAPVYPSTDRSVPQRQKDIAKAKQLLAEAGVPNGFEVTLTTEQYQEIPTYAVLIKNAAAEIGIKINLNVMDQGAYYGSATYGNSPWLDSELGITDYGHRGTPNVILSAPLVSNGSWNSAHFKNPAYDKLVADYVAAVDLDTQRKTAKQIETLLNDEVPVIFGYFYDFLIPQTKKVKGITGTALSQLFLQNASVV
ncbi:peptide/nickel transport system substrate-binding protein [Arboricoccus pini]|uniref:Peptide/nickel transport system substrate-binding protein n=1 Tax=Arboricoccus pini TaxID=1963835 RepID=A0A212RRY0_9PROT|nr:ABC transporter substrate-binding protein [Arboricoccus pini]SNB75382.1 peptide/nickel transport system substrate-binding protein [Arboricoccus pini]